MSLQPDNHHAVRRVVLPSGKTIEIVCFADSEHRDAAGAAPCSDRLHSCPDCTSTLVYPTEWEQADGDRWELALRCPNCEWLGEGVFAQSDVELLDEELDKGTQVLVRDLKHLMHANMEDEVERFIDLLHAGHIWPIDF